MAILLSGCGGSSDQAKVATLGSAVTDDSTTIDTSTPQSTQDALLAFTACMRTNGVDMADPTFDADGNATLGIGPDSGIDPQSEVFQAAQEACAEMLKGVTLGGGPGGGFDPDEIQNSLNDFTACLRDEGLEVDDITFGPPGGGPGGADGTPPDGTDVIGGGGFQPNDGVPGGSGPPQGGPGGADGFDPTALMIARLGLDDSDPAVTTALEACQPILDTAFQPTQEPTG